MPAAYTLLQGAVTRGNNIDVISAELLRMLDRHGAAELPNAVRLVIERRHEQRSEAPPVAVDLPGHIKTRDAAVRPHRLETYDQLKDRTNNDQTNKDETR